MVQTCDVRQYFDFEINVAPYVGDFYNLMNNAIHSQGYKQRPVHSL